MAYTFFVFSYKHRGSVSVIEKEEKLKKSNDKSTHDRIIAFLKVPEPRRDKHQICGRGTFRLPSVIFSLCK